MAAVSTYLTAITLVLGLGSFAAAAHLHARYSPHGRGKVLRWYAAVLAVPVVTAAVVFGPANVLGRMPSLATLLIAVPGGCVLGAACRAADRRIIRQAARSRARSAREARALRPAERRDRVTSAPGALLLGGGPARAVAPPRNRVPVAGDPSQYPLPTVLVVAVLEELFYRGVLVSVAFQVGTPLATAAVLVLVTTAFSLAHLFFGWEHVLAKTPLGLGCLLITLALGNVLAAVIAHAWFNLSAWRDIAAAPRRAS